MERVYGCPSIQLSSCVKLKNERVMKNENFFGTLAMGTYRHGTSGKLCGNCDIIGGKNFGTRTTLAALILGEIVLTDWVDC